MQFTRRTCWRPALALTLATVLPGCQRGVPDTVKIGVAMTLSGPTGNRGQDLLNGALLAAEELNTTGFRAQGKQVKFEIVAKDDKADNQLAKQVAQELVNDGVRLVLGHTNSPQLQAALPTYVAARALLLTTTTQRTLMDQGGGQLFRLVPNDRVQARALAMYATEQLGGQRLVALVEATDYGRGMFDDLSQTLKEKQLKVVEKIDLDFKKPVGEEVARKIKALKADVVVLIAREQHGLSLLEQLRAVQYADPIVLASNAVRTDKMAQAQLTVRGLYTTSTTISLAELSAGTAFRNRFVARFKSEPVWGAHYAYDAIYALADIIRRTGSMDTQDLAAKMRTSELNTRIVQQLRFGPSGEQAYPAIGVYKAERGAWSPQLRSSDW
jgi:branched-chain amino acid transport system substrate-binding protein